LIFDPDDMNEFKLSRKSRTLVIQNVILTVG
jgi:hypothetical protein